MKHFTLILANFDYVFGHEISKNPKIKIPTPRALTRTLAASFKPNMATIREVCLIGTVHETFHPNFGQYIFTPKVHVFLKQPKKPIPCEIPTSSLQILK